MKMIKLFAFGALLCGSVHAATVTVGAGFGATNGLLVTAGGVGVASQYIAVGSWNGTVFTQFATTLTDTSTVQGVFSAQAPTSVNSQIIHLYVSNIDPGAIDANDLTAGGSWVIFRTSTNVLFPSDVSSALTSANPTFSNFTTAVNVAQSTNYEEVGARTINFTIPEPSAALLGALGALGLLRRRRI
jgi:hypothetical protein